MEIVKPLLLCAAVLVPSLDALELKSSLGVVSYQVEGKGPTSSAWIKPSYTKQPYVELESKDFIHSTNYWKARLEYIGGTPVLETNQPLFRKVQTSILHGGWGWIWNGDFEFEGGIIGLGQVQEIQDSALTASATESELRLGNYFAIGYKHNFGLWGFVFNSSIGVLGWPNRQSAVSQIEFALNRGIASSPWTFGFKVKEGYVELERNNNKTADLGAASNALLLFKQTETDTAIWAFTVGYKL